LKLFFRLWIGELAPSEDISPLLTLPEEERRKYQDAIDDIVAESKFRFLLTLTHAQFPLENSPKGIQGTFQLQ
jgi:hypothetical protein